jgi:hypothetical protein
VWTGEVQSVCQRGTNAPMDMAVFWMQIV